MNSTPNYGFDKGAKIKLCGFDAVDRELHRIEQQTQCALAAKADKCALEKHLLECHNCGKPCRECDCYTKEEVDKLLVGKVDKMATQEYALNLSITATSGYYPYSKDPFGRVFLYVALSKITALQAGETIGTLPIGFRPEMDTNFPAIYGKDGTSDAGLIRIKDNGEIVINDENTFLSTHTYIHFIAFFTAH